MLMLEYRRDDQSDKFDTGKKRKLEQGIRGSIIDIANHHMAKQTS